MSEKLSEKDWQNEVDFYRSIECLNGLKNHQIINETEYQEMKEKLILKYQPYLGELMA